MSEEKKNITTTVAEFDTKNKNDRIFKTPVDPMQFDKNSPYYQGKKAESPIVFDVPTKSFEDKKYIVLINQESNDELFDGQYKVCNGRTECYRYIQTLIEAFGEDIDAHNSKVITETKQVEADTGNSKYYMINLSDAVSVYAFCKSVEGYYRGTVYDFSIDDVISPPEGIDIPISEEKLNDDAFSYAASIDDPIIAQAAMDAFKERAHMLYQRASAFPKAVESIQKEEGISPYASLFEDDGDSRNI